MTAINPMPLLKEILRDAGHTDVHSDRFDATGLSASEYVFLRQVGGVTPHTDSLYRVTIEFALISKDGHDEAWNRLSKIQSDLKDRWGFRFSTGGIHRMVVRLSPTRQDIPGLPYGVGRTVSQIDFVLRTLEGWV